MVYLKGFHMGYAGDLDLNFLSGCVNLESIHITGKHIRNAEGLSNLISVDFLGLHESELGKEPIMNDLEQLETLEIFENGSERVKEQAET